MKVHIYPEFAGEDKGDGGVRQVVDAQRRYLPNFGVELVDDPAEADVIACHITMPSTYLVRFPNKPIVAHCHGLYWAEYAWDNWALKANAEVMSLLRVADAITAPSEWVAQAIRRATMRPVAVVNHGVEIPKGQSAVESKGFVLWNKTRTDSVCNPTVVNRLAELLPEVEFVTTFANPAPNVTVTGCLPFAEAQTLLAEAGVYLCTTRETFGIGTLEAMALGVPVVGYNFGGQAEFLTHKKDAWLVPPDDVEGLAEGVKWALANRAAIAKAGLKTVKKFTQEQAAAKYAQVYESVFDNRAVESPLVRVSVIVPAYNMEKYLADCLASVHQQTAEDWECIVVDDASTDRTGAIADEFAKQDHRIRVIHNKKNQYLAAARNIAIEQAKGKYILPLDADDMLTPDTLKILADALDKDRTAAIVYGGVLFTDEDGKTPTDYHAVGETIGHSGWPLPYRHDWMMRGPGQLMPYASMYRREVWEYTCGYRTRCRSSEDQDFWLRAVSYGFQPKMATNADTLIYRNREDSMSHTEGRRDHRSWYPWSFDSELSPAGAVTELQLPVPSMDPPLIAVIIPVGPAHEPYLLDAVDSVDAQAFRQWECIVVNDTGAPLGVRLPSWVRLIESDRGHGVAHARNIGVKASRAPLLVFLDADDFLQPYALGTMLQVWRQVDGVVYSDWWDEFSPSEVKLYEAPEWDAHLLTKNGAIHAVTALYPYSAWEAVGGFDENLVAWEDWDFALSLADKGICGTRIPEPLWTYRKYTGMRREENYSNFEVSKAAILSKWADIWNGGRKLMGCGACPGGGGKKVRTEAPAGRQVMSSEVPNLDEVVLVEYTGVAQGARTFRGPATETQYRFASSETERVKYVVRSDIGVFVNRPDFRILEGVTLAPPGVVVPEGDPILVAEGAPAR